MYRRTLRRAGVGALAAVVLGVPVEAQHPMNHAMSDTGKMRQMMAGPLGVSLDRMGSGTTWIPDAAPLPMHHTMAGAWELMVHGTAFVQYDKQGSDRGGDQFGSMNWAMLMASRKAGDGLFQARTMLSLEPATVTPSGYPLLLQTGESHNGVPLHDRQHPHDVWMELGALYQQPLSSRLALELYAAPVGEPALGPVAYMHRPSALDNPLAPIGHHWQDATHISFGVLTAGLYGDKWKLEGSVFNGREPDEDRWNLDPIRLDSYSGRLTINPDSQWSATAGYGFLASPEAMQPGESVHRLTASVINARKLRAGQVATSLVWGANDMTGAQGWTNAALLESEAILDRRNTVFGRVEVAQKTAEELVLPTSAFPASARFDVGELSLGYIRDVVRLFGATGGIGVMGTINRVPGDLAPFYGTHLPLGALVFFRIRPAFAPSAPSMGTMHMRNQE
jgi:hypothetical protein